MALIVLRHVVIRLPFCVSTTARTRFSCALFAHSSSVEGYLTIAEKHSCETEVKKSKFLATSWPITSSSQALQFVAEAKDPAASHNCFAYKLDHEFRSTDDGEPGGTAGRPILGSIEGEGLNGVCVLVTRYYGGTKLGAGGLVRAYAGAARTCLQQAGKVTVKPQTELRVHAAFEQIGTLYQLAEQHHAERLSEDYEDSGQVTLRLRIEQTAVEALNSALLGATAGAVRAEIVD